MNETWIYRPVSPTGDEFVGIGLSVVCPVCNHDYIHFANREEQPTVSRVAGHDDYTAWKGRGSAVFVPMACEYDGHAFEIGIGFHKGQTWIFTRHQPQPEPAKKAHPSANGSGGWHAR